MRPLRDEVWITEAYPRAVLEAGGLPLLVPPGLPEVDALLDRAGAVVLSGGYFDIHPSEYGEEVEGRLDRVEPARTAVELQLARRALARGIPILGVCGGMQALAVAAGGKLVQDVPKGPLDHEQPTDPASGWHEIAVTGAGLRWLSATELVNSTHHQAVRLPGSGLEVCARAPDGTVEMIAATEGFAVGVQWHPELMGDLRLYRALVQAAVAR